MPGLKNIAYLATCRDEGGQGEIHPIRDAAVVWREDQIIWVGHEADMPEKYAQEYFFDAGHTLVIPGLVDCHTHLAFGGWRADEFEMRLKGKSYLDISKAGGGILSTVRATRAASERALYKKAAELLGSMTRLGVTAIECKSGYGLTLEDELKILQVYKTLRENNPQHIIPTFLGAHTIPPEYKSKRAQYIDLVIGEMIPAVASQKLAEFCDVFVEESAFSVDEARRILRAAKAAGLTPKLHADQLTSGGGAELAAELGAVSADHLEKISEGGIAAMAEAKVIGVVLPLASLFTRQPFADGRKLVEGGVAVAVATDFNPGSAPTYDLPLAMMLACTMNRLTPAEALKGATVNAAKAIHRDSKIGSVEPGKSADFVIVDAQDPNFWLYHYRPDSVREVFLKGKKTDIRQNQY